MESFKKIANSEGHAGYRKENNQVFSHTMDEIAAEKMVNGYVNVLNNILNIKYDRNNRCLDIGCGAAFATKYFNENGFNMAGMEYSQDALNIAKKYNDNLDIFQGDMSKFREENSYDFIFSREVYLITRVNCFTEQLKIINNIIDSLKNNGSFMLVASDVSYPHCMDYDLIMKTITEQSNIDFVSHKYIEAIFRHFNKYIKGPISYKIIECILSPYLYMKKKKRWAKQYIIVFKKK